MTLNLIGIGLASTQDITLKAKKVIHDSDVIYLENYTSFFESSLEELETFCHNKIILANRETVEGDTNDILENAKSKNVTLLVIGDPLSATTHVDLLNRAKELNIKTTIIHNASVLTSVAETGLQLYKFAKTTSIPLQNENIESPYNILKQNQSIGAHTLFLLDLSPKDATFLSANKAIEYLYRVESVRKENLITDEIIFIVCARLGYSDQQIKAGTAQNLRKIDFGKPPHCLIVPGELHFVEEEHIQALK